jgi:DNA-binding SARP family transcriptional activator
MRLHTLIDQYYQTFLEQSQSARIILLHPQSRYRSMLVAKLMNSPDLQVFYYALGPDDIDLPAFLSAITHDIAWQQPMFGRHLNMLSPNVFEDVPRNFELLLNTFLKDIAELSSNPFLLILDEYDRSDSADDVQLFIEKLSGRLPTHCKLVVNSRTLPRLPWVSMIARHDAVMLQDDQLITQNFYGIEHDEGVSKLEVYALGPGFVLMNGQPIDTWEGHLPRLLFFFALDRPIVTRSEICQAFWPELDDDQAVNVFHVTKRRLHKALDMDVLVHEGGYYRVNPDMAIYYDATDFVTSLIGARGESDPNLVADWQRAADLYRGPFLQGHNDAWIVDRRRDFCAGYLEALSHIAHFWLEQGRREHALSLFQRALVEDFAREDIHRQLMKLYAQLGRRSEVAAHYQRLFEDFKKAGKSPSSETQAVYAEIMG